MASKHRQRRLHDFLQRLSVRLVLEGARREPQIRLGRRELAILRKLLTDGETSLRRLASELMIPASSMTAIVDRMEANRLVRRRPLDRRSVALAATGEARLALRNLARVPSSLAAEILEALPERDQQTLVDLVHRVGRVL